MLFVLAWQADTVDVRCESNALAQRDQSDVVVQIGRVEFLVDSNVLHSVVGMRKEFVGRLGVLWGKDFQLNCSSWQVSSFNEPKSGKEVPPKNLPIHQGEPPDSEGSDLSDSERL